MAQDTCSTFRVFPQAKPIKVISESQRIFFPSVGNFLLKLSRPLSFQNWKGPGVNLASVSETRSPLQLFSAYKFHNKNAKDIFSLQNKPTCLDTSFLNSCLWKWMQFGKLHDIVHIIDPALGKRIRCKDVAELDRKDKTRLQKKEEMMILSHISLCLGNAKCQPCQSWDNVLIVVSCPVLILRITTIIESRLLCQLSQKQEKLLWQWNCDQSVFCVRNCDHLPKPPAFHDCILPAVCQQTFSFCLCLQPWQNRRLARQSVRLKL